jgi:hypothetical protein
MRVGTGKNTWTDPQITEALACAEEMEAQRRQRSESPEKRK